MKNIRKNKTNFCDVYDAELNFFTIKQLLFSDEFWIDSSPEFEDFERTMNCFAKIDFVFFDSDDSISVENMNNENLSVILKIFRKNLWAEQSNSDVVSIFEIKKNSDLTKNVDM